MGRTKAQTTAQETTATAPVATTLSFAEKLQMVNTYLETLRIDVAIAKKQTRLATLISKDEKTEEEVNEQRKLELEIKELETVKKDFIKATGQVDFEQAVAEKFAFICGWSINPQKGNVYTEKGSNTKVYDIAFEGMFKVAVQIERYYKCYLDKPDSTEKTQAKKELVTVLDEFVNKYLDYAKPETKLKPCKETTVELIFAKYDKNTTVLTKKEYALPKNCMEDGYKPMKVHFVDTDEKPMVKEVVTACANKFKWTKNGITRNKMDVHAVVQQVFLVGLKYCLDFGTGEKVVKTKAQKLI